MVSTLRHGFFAATFAIVALLTGQVMAHDAQEGPVRHAMMSVFDKPTDPLKVDPVVVSGDYAVAGWVQSGKGGRAVLQKTHGQWNIMVCGGDGLKDARALEQTGMSTATAAALAKAMNTAESKVSADTRKKFAMFDGVVKVNAGHGNHHPEQPAVKHP